MKRFFSFSSPVSPWHRLLVLTAGLFALVGTVEAGQPGDWFVALDAVPEAGRGANQPSGLLLRTTLTNTSGRDLTIQDARESRRGYHTVYFTVTEPGGRSFRIRRGPPRSWSGPPDDVVVPWKGSYAIDRSARELLARWTGWPRDFPGGPVDIQADYKVEEAASSPYWIGEASSNTLQVTIDPADVQKFLPPRLKPAP